MRTQLDIKCFIILDYQELGDQSPSSSFFVSMGQELHGSSTLAASHLSARNLQLQTDKNKKPSGGNPSEGLKINSNFLAPHYKYRQLIVPPKKGDSLPSNENNKNDLVKKNRVTWARLLKRVFDVDVETCGVCGGKVKIIAAIKEGEVIKKILDHIGLPSVPPEIALARGPSDFAFDDNFSHDTNPFFLR